MNRVTRLLSVSLAAVVVAGFALAQTALEPMAAHEAREAHMKQYGANIGILGGMAQGQTAYDAVAAQAAADKLVELTMVDQSTWWPVGSSSDDIPDSRVLPIAWDQMDDMVVKHEALGAAALAMQTAAGVDLASLQGAMAALGGACGSCHETYRKPE
jgi:cytochrome c556